MREAPDAEALMRSRYAAFAKKDVDYLWRTLDARHEDRSAGELETKRRIKATASALKYPGLTILDARPPDGEGIARVLFLARVFDSGRDRSFVEVSEFAHDGDGWRYVSGDALPVAALRQPAESLTIETFIDVLSRG